jgi:hypothetical protein
MNSEERNVILEDVTYFVCIGAYVDSLCGLVVRVSGYRSRGTGFDSRP